jgi:Protein of unknown function (DUF3891)
MVLRPEGPPAHPVGGFVSAWEAVARAQKTISTKYLLVRQPDHARLAGQLAEQLAIPGAPAVDDDIVRGISLHDEGWTDFDCGRKRLQATIARYSETNVALNAEGKPLSFLEIKAGDFLLAWLGSIQSAEAVAPIAGLMVSGHFRRIGQFGMSTGTYSESDTYQVREFIAHAEQRERRLMQLQSHSDKEVEYWTDALQFCDLLSLYLCCGSEESVEFPQRIGPKGETIRLQVQNGANVLSPSPFARDVDFALQAQSYPPQLHASSTKLNWRMR